MDTPTSGGSEALGALGSLSDGPTLQAGVTARLPPLLSVIAGMVDLTGFFTLG